MSDTVNRDKEIWEGWTVGNFIDELEFSLDRVMSGQSWEEPLRDREALKKWCCENQPYYKKYIPEVVDYFADKYGLR